MNNLFLCIRKIMAIFKKLIQSFSLHRGQVLIFFFFLCSWTFKCLDLVLALKELPKRTHLLFWSFDDLVHFSPHSFHGHLSQEQGVSFLFHISAPCFKFTRRTFLTRYLLRFYTYSYKGNDNNVLLRQFVGN